MEYVEFTFNQKINQLTCKWYLKNKPRLIHLNDAKTLFRELTRTQAPYKIREIGDKQIIRYYNVNRVLYYQIERNRKNAQSKVARQNKFKRQVLALTSSLAAPLGAVSSARYFVFLRKRAFLSLSFPKLNKSSTNSRND